MEENGRTFVAKERGMENVIEWFEDDILHICRGSG